MRLAFVPFALLTALSGGCTIHVVEQPASASAWSAPPPPPSTVVVQQPAAPTPAPAPVPAEQPQRVTSRARPSDFGRVTTRPPSSKPHPSTGPREPRPTQPVATRPVTTKPAPKPPAAEAPVDNGWGRYPYSITKPEPRHPEHARDRGDPKLVRPPVAATR